jgi:hypothetical protein
MTPHPSAEALTEDHDLPRGPLPSPPHPPLSAFPVQPPQAVTVDAERSARYLLHRGEAVLDTAGYAVGNSPLTPAAPPARPGGRRERPLPQEIPPPTGSRITPL